MAHNITTRQHTNHMDIRYKYVNEYDEDRVVKIIFVGSVNNDSNILTKNLGQSFTRSIQKKVGYPSFKIFEVKRKHVTDNVLTSNSLFENVQ